MKLTILLLAYLFYSGTGNLIEKVADGYLREACKQLAVSSDRAATAFQDNRCYHCGTCCKLKSCRDGEWDINRRQCAYLAIEKQTPEYTTYLCQKYTEIIKRDQDRPLPVFGRGCSNVMYNQAREKIRRSTLT